VHIEHSVINEGEEDGDHPDDNPDYAEFFNTQLDEPDVPDAANFTDDLGVRHDGWLEKKGKVMRDVISAVTLGWLSISTMTACLCALPNQYSL